MGFAWPLLLAVAAPASADDGDAARVGRWRADLAQLASELPKRHKHLFFAQPREEWEARVEELDAQLDALEDHEILGELMRLVASVGDGHTGVRWFQGPVARKAFPLQFHPFSDGLRVVLAPRDLAWSLGARVTAVGGLPIDEVQQRLAEAIPHDNEAGLLANLPQHLETTWIPHALGFGDDREHATFTLETDSGDARELVLGPDGGLAPGALAKVGAEPAELPLWRRRRGEAYWFEWVEEQRLLYLQYNRCADAPELPFAKLVEQLAALADAQPVETFLIDLRHNGGGNSLVINPLFGAMGARKELRGKGRLFVAIGERTFSSAMMNAVQLRDGFGALLVGTPTGGKPRSYGEIKFLELANSKLQVSYSTKLFDLVASDAPSVMPDVEAPCSFAHWKEGRDPVVEAIAGWRKEQDVAGDGG